MIKSILVVVSIAIIGMAIGVAATFFYFKSKIAEFKVEQVRMDAFAECMESKIIGQGEYAELMLLDVLECLKLVNNN